MSEEQKAGEVKTLIPTTWTQESFLTGTALEWLWEQQNNKSLFPIILQRAREKAEELGITRTAFNGLWKQFQADHESKQQILGDFVTMFPDQPKQLRSHYYVCDQWGVAYTGSKGEEIKVCSHPIMPTKRFVNHETNEQSIEISYARRMDKDGKLIWKSTVQPRTVIASAQKIVAPLAAIGIDVHSENAKEMVKYLAELESINYDDLPVETSIDHMGWIENDFFPYTEDIVYDGPADNKRILKAITEHGDYEKWLSLVKEIRADAKVVPRIFLACSFASALIGPFGKLCFWVHLHSDRSTTGKTVCLMLAASIWGNPRAGAGYIQTVNGTDAGFEFKCSFLRDIPLILDESQTRENQKFSYSELIYKHGEGMEKPRGNVRGTMRRMREWHNCAMSTGEQNIVSSRDHAGVLARTICLYEANQLFSDPRNVADTVKENYGYAGRKYVEAVTNSENREALKKVIRQYLIELENVGITPKQADTGSLILAADKLATTVLFRDGRNLTIEDIKPYLRTNDDIDINRRLHEQIIGSIVQHQANFLTGDNTQQPPRDIWGKIDKVERHWYFKPDTLQTEIESRGGDYDAYVNWCISKGYVIDHRDVKDGKKVGNRGKKVRLVDASPHCIDFYLPELMENPPDDKPMPQSQPENPGTVPDRFTPVTDPDMPF